MPNINILIQSNQSLQYAVLVGVTPTSKSGWYSGLNNIEVRCFNLVSAS
jgi:hypothetical protein